MKRLALLSIVRLMAALACACFVVPLWFAGWWPEWRHQSGTRTYAWGMGSTTFYVISIDRPTDTSRVEGETGVVSMSHSLGERSFFVGKWSRDLRDVYYSTAPNETYDPGNPSDRAKLVTYRGAIEHDRQILYFRTWRYAALLGLLPGVVFARRAVRYVRRRRALLDHCGRCGYDLRATPDRCPECGTVTPG